MDIPVVRFYQCFLSCQMLFLSLSVSTRLFYAMLSVPVVNIQTVQVSESFRSAYFFGLIGSIGFFHWKKHRKAPKALSVFEGFFSNFFSPQVEVIFGHFLEMREKFEGYRRKNIFLVKELNGILLYF